MSAVVGNKLRQAREERGITIEQAAQETYIRLRYLKAMEAGEFSALPSPAQQRGFLRAYATYLGLNPKPLLEDLGRDPILALDIPRKDQAASEQGAQDDGEDQVDDPFVRIGRQLRKQRETLGLTYDDVEHHTHIKDHYLAALEDGRIDDLPSPVQGRGMLNNYAEFLGMDTDSILLQYAEGLQFLLQKKRKAMQQKQRSESRSRRRRGPLVARDVIVFGIMVLFVISVAVFSYARISEMRALDRTPQPTAPSIADVLVPSPTATQAPTPTATLPSLLEEGEATQAPVEPTPVPTEAVIVPLESTGPIQVRVVVRQRAWMRVTVDDEVAFEGRVLPGTAYAFAAEDRFEILTGNAAAIQLVYNQQDLGILGIFGEVVNFVITREGVQTPTPTVTFTPTETPPETSTPTVTPTP